MMQISLAYGCGLILHHWIYNRNVSRPYRRAPGGCLPPGPPAGGSPPDPHYRKLLILLLNRLRELNC